MGIITSEHFLTELRRHHRAQSDLTQSELHTVVRVSFSTWNWLKISLFEDNVKKRGEKWWLARTDSRLVEGVCGRCLDFREDVQSSALLLRKRGNNKNVHRTHSVIRNRSCSLPHPDVWLMSSIPRGGGGRGGTRAAAWKGNIKTGSVGGWKVRSIQLD